MALALRFGYPLSHSLAMFVLYCTEAGAKSSEHVKVPPRETAFRRAVDLIKRLTYSGVDLVSSQLRPYCPY